MTKVLLFAALVACIAVPFRVFVKGEQTKHRYKTTHGIKRRNVLWTDAFYRRYDVLRQRICSRDC